MLEQTVFTANKRFFTTAHILQAAEYRDDVEPVRAHLKAGLASAQYAEEQGFAADSTILREAVNTFRYEHGLLSGEKTHRWLKERGLTVTELESYLERKLWARRFRNPSDPGYPSPEGKMIKDALWSEVVLGGHFLNWATQLAWRVIAYLEQGYSLASTFDSDQLTELEAVYNQKLREILTTEACRRELSSQRLTLIQIEINRAGFTELSEAREAYMCLTEDFEGFQDVARRTGAVYESGSYFLDDLPKQLEPHLISAVEGTTLQPVKESDSWWVYQVIQKIEPVLTDPKVVERIHRSLLKHHYENLEHHHIVWEIDLRGDG